MARWTRIRALALTAALALALSACGGDDEGDDGVQSNEDGSVFALDVGTDSFDDAAHALLKGEKPTGRSRPQEFVNAFGQDYPEPEGDGVSVTADGAKPPAWYPSAPQTRIVRIGLRTKDLPKGGRAAASLTFVVDVSTSMGEGGKLDAVKSALHGLIDQLKDGDSMAVVAFDKRAKALRSMTPVKNGRDLLHAAVDKLKAGEETDLEKGLATGYVEARSGYSDDATNRLVLVSDDLSATGVTDASPMMKTVAEEAAGGISLVGVGIGVASDPLLESMADAGGGFTLYVKDADPKTAEALFAERLPTSLAVQGRDTKVRVTFDKSTVASFRAIGFEPRVAEADDFRDDSADGGELPPGHSVTALYEVTLKDGASGPVGKVYARWLSSVDGGTEEAVANLKTGDLERDWASAPAPLRVDLLAASLALVLSGDAPGDVWLPPMTTEAEELAGSTKDKAVERLVTLLKAAK